MCQQQCNLPVAEARRVDGKTLLVRALAENTERFQPTANPCRMPTVTIARQQQLMPCAAPGVPSDGAAHRDRRLAHQRAVLFRCGAITQRLVLQIAAISNEMTKQRNRMVRPFDRYRWFGRIARDGEPFSDTQIRNLPP